MTIVLSIAPTTLSFFSFLEGTLAITCRIPRAAAQRLIKEVCSKKEWDKLHMLFLGGDSQRSYPKGRGGVATGCNAVIVPIDQVLASSVKDRNKLIAVLLDHGALANGPHGCKTPPLSVAMEMEDYAIAYTLLKHGADPSVIGCCKGTASHHREVINHVVFIILCIQGRDVFHFTWLHNYYEIKIDV